MRQKNKAQFLPVILGTDMNAYTMAISFYSQYGIKPVLVGRIPMAFTKDSSLIQAIYYNDETDDTKGFAEYLEKIALLYSLKYETLLLIGTNDFYVKLIIDNQESLSRSYLFNYVDRTLFKQLYLKKSFYELCAEYKIDTPLTFFYCTTDKESFNESVPFPAIIKPSNGVKYYDHPFEGMQKVYKVHNNHELQEVIHTIKKSGYDDELVIQDFIPGDDTFMWDAVYYANQHGKGELITFAQVVLQEHTKTGVGNYTALIVRENKKIMNQLVSFMEALNYTGFANFDIKYDARDKKYKVFEVNVRQGRSSYYATQCGQNLAQFFVEDLLDDKEKPLHYLNKHFLFTVVPIRVLKEHVHDAKISNEITALVAEGNVGNPLFYSADKSLKRTFFMLLRHIHYFQKYKQENWQD